MKVEDVGLGFGKQQEGKPNICGGSRGRGTVVLPLSTPCGIFEAREPHHSGSALCHNSMSTSLANIQLAAVSSVCLNGPGSTIDLNRTSSFEGCESPHTANLFFFSRGAYCRLDFHGLEAVLHRTTRHCGGKKG